MISHLVISILLLPCGLVYIQSLSPKELASDKGTNHHGDKYPQRIWTCCSLEEMRRTFSQEHAGSLGCYDLEVDQIDQRDCSKELHLACPFLHKVHYPVSITRKVPIQSVLSKSGSLHITTVVYKYTKQAGPL